MVESGYKSISAVTFPFAKRGLINLALFKISGPDNPKWVKSIFPFLENCFCPLRKKVIFINDNDRPDNSLGQSSLISIGTISGEGSLTSCPKFLKNLKPSPVEPVSG